MTSLLSLARAAWSKHWQVFIPPAALLGPYLATVYPSALFDLLPPKPGTRKASNEASQRVIDILESYGVKKASDRVKVFESDYQPGQHNDVYVMGSGVDIRVIAPSPFLQPPTTPFSIAYPIRSKFLHSLTPQQADSSTTFLEARKNVMKTDKVLPFTEKEMDVSWRSVAAEIHLKTEVGAYFTAFFAWWASTVFVYMPIARKTAVPAAMAAHVTFLATFGGMLYGARDSQEKLVDAVCTEKSVIDASLQKTYAERDFNLVRKADGDFLITEAGNDIARNMAPLTRRIDLIVRAKNELELKASPEGAPTPEAESSPVTKTK